MAEITVKKEKILYEGHGVLKEISFVQPIETGEQKEQTRVLFNHGNAVTALLYNPEKKTVLLIHQFRLATFVNGNPDGFLLETCAGLLEEDESPNDAMIREIREETGYEVENLQKIGEAYSSPGAYTELIHYYIASYRDEQKVGSGGGLAEEGEHLKIVELPFAKAFAQAANGEIKDAKTLFLLFYAKANGLLD